MRDLSGFSGVLKVDGYAGIAPWRKRARSSSPSAGDMCAGASMSSAPPARHRSPGEEPPDLDGLVMWLREKLDCVSQKSKLAEAIRYALSRWDKPLPLHR